MNAGGPRALARSWIVRNDGTTETIQSNVVTRLAPGDKVVIETAGGGGYGPPEERDPQAVEEDVLNEKVSREAAKSVYGWSL